MRWAAGEGFGAEEPHVWVSAFAVTSVCHVVIHLRDKGGRRAMSQETSTITMNRGCACTRLVAVGVKSGQILGISGYISIELMILMMDWMQDMEEKRPG